MNYEGEDFMPKTKLNKEELKRDQVRTAAYYLWEKAGRPDGKDLDFWVEAEHNFKKKKKAIEITLES